MRSTLARVSLALLFPSLLACGESPSSPASEGSETQGDGDGDGDPAGDGDGDTIGDGDGDPTGDGDGDTIGDGDGDPTGDGDGDMGGDPLDPVSVSLTPQPGIAGLTRVNFGLPFAPGQLQPENIDTLLVRAGDEELATALELLATHPDGSVRSVQVQTEVNIDQVDSLTLEFDAAPTLAGALAAVPVSDTLVDPSGSEGPRVWVGLPATWLASSGVAGPLRPESEDQDSPFAAWIGLCDYEAYDFATFEAEMGTAGAWLYDRGTTAYRGYARGGQLGRLESAYKESAIYRAGLTGSGADTNISVPGKSGDLKYFYAQNLAIHYLLSGDERFRESAEDIALASAQLWSDPGYAGGADFWTERHAGFALLNYVWAAAVSDDQSPAFRTLADEAVAAYVELQASDYPGASADARCFRHHADAHGESYGYMGCSPWMSAILADGLDAYARQRPNSNEAQGAHDALLRLGRIVATQGLDDSGKPFYWMGAGDDQDEVDSYDEHWGESAYLVAIAVHLGAAELEATALELVAGLGANGSAPHIRSFNWQCRSAVASSWFLAD